MPDQRDGGPSGRTTTRWPGVVDGAVG